MTKILWKLDPETIRWQYCAICGGQTQRIIQEEARPDFVLCEQCRAAFVMADSAQQQLFYGRIPATMPDTRAFALQQWRTYAEVSALAREERQRRADTSSAAQDYPTNMDAYMALSQQRREESQPKVLKETGELPDLDSLFRDPD